MNEHVTTLARVKGTAAALAERFAETAGEIDRTAVLPVENFRTIAEAGLLGLVIDTEHGGLGGGLAEAIAVVGEIAKGEPSTALLLAQQYLNHGRLTTPGTWPAGIMEEVLAGTRDGSCLVNAAQVEPGLGSPSRGGLPATLARRTSDGWSITGHKQFVTGAPILSYVNVLAVTDEPEQRVGTFVVPMSAPGLRIVETWDTIGMRATGSHDVVLENTPVRFEHTLGPLHLASEGARKPDPAGFAWYYGLISAVYDGVARAAQDWLLHFLNTRVPGNLGAPLATVPRLQEAAGAIGVLLATNQRLLRSLTLLPTADPEIGDAGVVKHVVVSNAIRVTEIALEIVGNHGLNRANPLERHHRDVICGQVHNPQNDVIRTGLGKAALAASKAAAAG
ncbi:MAG: acyl-CoA/acyl-ACP dehydrogenase [Bauldia sp.]|nr:acyl-CoA/acyl-ACP dehydrogenase [Bauldia sp.]